MLNKTRLALAFSAITLAACGGGGGGDSTGGTTGGTGGGTTNPAPAAVAGPLDPAQNAVQNSVFAPLTEATADTPLQSVIVCANSVVTRNTLDILDSFAANLSDPASLATTGPADAQGAVTALVGNLSGLLGALTGETTCLGGSSGDIPVPTTNPLAGTPLEALGTALLPALTDAQEQLTGGTGGTPPTLSAAQLQGILGQLAGAYNGGIAMLPPEALTAPVVGGTLVTVGHALDGLVDVTGSIDSMDPATIAGTLQTTVEGLLNDLLTLVLPASALQDAAGAGAPDVTGMIEAAVAQLTSSIGTDPTTALPANPLTTDAFAPLTDLVSQLTAALSTGGLPTSGTPLDAAAVQLTDLLNSLFAPVTGGTGTGTTCLLGILCLPG